MKIYREFTQEWTNQISKFNHFKENNVLYDFFDYCDQMHNALQVIKNNYSDEFNNNAKRTIDTYIKLFNYLIRCFKKICFKSDNFKDIWSAMYLIEKVSEKILITEGNRQKIKNEYFPMLKKIARYIFKIEAEMADVIEDIWIKNLTSSLEHNDYYSYLAHVMMSWRRDSSSDALHKYCKQLKTISTSYINKDKTRFFKEEEYGRTGMIGSIIKIKKGAFIAGSNNDMFTTEWVDGACEFNEKYFYSPVKCLYKKGNSVVLGSGTRISTPISVLENSVSTPSEILLDRAYIEYERAFYVNPVGYERNDMKPYAEKIKTQNNVEPLKLSSRNRLNQLDLQTLIDALNM